MLHNYLEV